MAATFGPAGKRVPLIMSLSLTAGATGVVEGKPQMNFRAENLVIDPTTAAAFSVTMPQVGTTPQIAGGSSSQAVPATAFPPTQTDAVKFSMDIAEQGNAITLNATNNGTVTATFVAMLFGYQAQQQGGGGGASTGVAPAGAWRG